jgi:hypothetical protein
VVEETPQQWSVSAPDLGVGVQVYLGWSESTGPGRCPFAGETGGTVCLDLAAPARLLAQATTVADPEGGAIAVFDVTVPRTRVDTLHLQAFSRDGASSATSATLAVDIANADSDGDGLSDVAEQFFGLDSADPDVDDDGTLDGDEIFGGTDPDSRALTDVAFCSTVGGDFCLGDDDLLLWLRADDLALGGVGTWADRSTAGNDAGQADASRRPVAEAGVIGGHAAVRFDGSDDFLDFGPSLGLDGDPATVFLVLQPGAAGQSAHVFGTGDDGTLSTDGVGVTLENGRVTGKVIDDDTGARSAGGAEVSGPIVVSAVVSDDRLLVFSDGLDVAGQGIDLEVVVPFASATLGAADGDGSGTPSDAFDGHVAEVMVFDGALDDGVRKEIEQGLSGYYGLAYPTFDDCQTGLDTWDACGVCGGDGSTCSDITDLEPSLWLNAHGQTPDADGFVGSWESYDTTGRTADSAVVRRPLRVGHMVNGQATLTFDGRNDFLELSDNLFAAGSTPKTVFVVVDTDDPLGHLIGTGSGASGQEVTFGHGVMLLNGRVAAKAISGGSGVLVSGDQPADVGPRLFTAVIDATESSVRQDGGTQASSGAALNPHPYTITSIAAAFGDGSGGANGLDGAVGEILVFDERLELADIERVETYLSTRYGLPLAEDLSFDTVLELESATLAPFAEGATMTTWEDSSPLGRDVAEFNGAQKPTVHTLGNGSRVVRFDGIDDQLNLSSNQFFFGNTTQTVLMVLSTTDTEAHLIGTGSSSPGFLTSDGFGLVLDGGAPSAKALAGGTGLFLTGPRIDDGALHIVAVRFEPGGSDLYVDGVLADLGNLVDPIAAFNRATISAADGNAINATADPFGGDIAHIEAYNDRLSTDDLAQRTGELAAPYGITLP